MAGMMVGTASYVPPEACLSNQLSQRIHSGRISRRQEAESAGSPLQAVMATPEHETKPSKEEGRLLKATGERWFGGHTVGRFEVKGVGEWNEGRRQPAIPRRGR